MEISASIACVSDFFIRARRRKYCIDVLTYYFIYAIMKGQGENRVLKPHHKGGKNVPENIWNGIAGDFVGRSSDPAHPLLVLACGITPTTRTDGPRAHLAGPFYFALFHVYYIRSQRR